MPEVNPPTSLNAFPSDTNPGVWGLPFYLNFDQSIISPQNLNYDLYIDTATTFSSPNNIRLTKTSVDKRLIGFQEGNGLGKEFLVRLPDRDMNSSYTWYWQVRINANINGTIYLSPWSAIQSLIVPQRQDLVQAQAIFANLADANAYSKDTSSTNVYKFLLQAGRELDLLLYENANSINDLSIYLARDTAIVNNFASLLNISQSYYETASNFRQKVQRVWKAFTTYPGSLQAIIDVVTAFTGQAPVIADVTTELGWILDFNILSDPPITVNSPIILYSRPQKGRTFELIIPNSWNLQYDEGVLTTLLQKIRSAQTDMALNFTPNKNVSVRFNLQSDWQLWTNTGCDIASYPGSVQLASGQSSGTLISPVFNISNLAAFNAPIISSFPSGGTISYYIATSSDGINFNPYYQLYQGVTPDTNLLIEPYFQIKITMSRNNISAPNPSLQSFELPMIGS